MAQGRQDDQKLTNSSKYGIKFQEKDLKIFFQILFFLTAFYFYLWLQSSLRILVNKLQVIKFFLWKNLMCLNYGITVKNGGNVSIVYDRRKEQSWTAAMSHMIFFFCKFEDSLNFESWNSKSSGDNLTIFWSRDAFKKVHCHLFCTGWLFQIWYNALLMIDA